ncbi:hypothetical protein BHE74_00037722 [Ensete ventricosum]|nr:hypothetical protein BHE74_00037722 [Ensete ventricosum]RZS15919.1 hypothetical protein BHM03_00047833 [Ensete ventricosum]
MFLLPMRGEEIAHEQRIGWRRGQRNERATERAGDGSMDSRFFSLFFSLLSTSLDCYHPKSTVDDQFRVVMGWKQPQSMVPPGATPADGPIYTARDMHKA